LVQFPGNEVPSHAAEGPQSKTREGWRVDGVEFKLRIDLAGGALGYRGSYKNPGA
jgi:hypothetical protein